MRQARTVLKQSAILDRFHKESGLHLQGVRNNLDDRTFFVQVACAAQGQVDVAEDLVTRRRALGVYPNCTGNLDSTPPPLK